MPAPDPAAIERQMYVDMVLGGVDDPSMTLADLRNLTGGGVNAYRAVEAANLSKGAPYYTKTQSDAALKQKVDINTLYFNVKDYGAKGDTATNDTVAVQAAISAAGVKGGKVFFPAGTYSVDGLTVPNYVTLCGTGPGSRVLGRAGAGPVITLNGCRQVTISDLRIDSVASHVIEAPYVYYLNIVRCHLIQYAIGYSIIHHDSAQAFIDVQVLDCVLDTVANNTVSAVSLTNSGNSLAATRWKNLRLNGANVTAAPFFLLRNTGAGNWTHDHSFHDITAELCDGGIIHASSVLGLNVDGVVPWDVVTYTEHIFWIDKDPASNESRSVVIRNSGRRGGAMTAGKSDVFFSSGCQDVTVDSCRASTGTIVVTLPTLYGVVRNSGEGSKSDRYAYGGSIKLPYPATPDRPSASVAGVGAMTYDSTLGKPIWSNGTVWKDAAGNTV